MQKYIDLAEKALEKYMQIIDNPQKKIYEAEEYSLMAGGKRLRPVIMMMTAKMCGMNPEKVIPFAVAIEMIHTYSLIHDDLPAMDNDDLRRGKPTNHKVFGEAMAILAGDALLTKAFETAASCDDIDSKLVIRAISVLAEAAGDNGMIGGQVVDIESRNEDEELLRYLHSLKTGALIKASGMIGAILAGATDEEVAAVERFCGSLGIAFQIQDDILDVVGTEAELGKPIGSDAENEKSTYVTLFGVEQAEKLAEEYTNAAISSLDIFSDNGELVALARKLMGRKA